MTPTLVLCRVTIHLPGGGKGPSPRPGHHVWVNPEDPYMAALIEQGHLVLLDQPEPAAGVEHPTEA